MAELMSNIVDDLFTGFTLFKTQQFARGHPGQALCEWQWSCGSLILTLETLSGGVRSVDSERTARESIPRRVPQRSQGVSDPGTSWQNLLVASARHISDHCGNPLNHPRIDPSFVLVLDHRVSDRQSGYTYVILGVLFLIYYTTIGKAVAAISPTAESAGILFSFLFLFVLTFDGVVQPVSQLGWWRWVYRVPPYMWNSYVACYDKYSL